MKYQKLLKLLSFLGMLVTAYLIYQHYKESADSFCNINNYISCDIVNKSIYAEIFGIPVSILGFLSYTLIFAGTFFLNRKFVIASLALFAGFGLGFSLYLTGIEFFALRAICIFCIAQQILIFFIFIMLFSLWSHERKSSRQRS